MKLTNSIYTVSKMAVAAFMVVLFTTSIVAQEATSAKASVKASHKEKVKKSREDGMLWVDVQGTDTYRVTATFTLNTAPADWSAIAREVWVSAGDLSFSPEIKKSKAGKGSANYKEKDKDFKSTETCKVKWSKRTISVTISGKNFDDDNIVSPDEDESSFREDVEITVDIGNITCEAIVSVSGSGRVTSKVITSGRGEDRETEDFDLYNWNAKGSGRIVGGERVDGNPQAVMVIR
ncbi:MAG: hypothetical protein GX230_02395 [Lentisphaerae bacterium]|nr:hypothetical protein [Lentisphaerota bacterium]